MFLDETNYPVPPTPASDGPSESPWTPFRDRLDFDWAYYHYVRRQSSKSDILEGLDLWRAAIIKHSSENESNDGVPWRTADELYQTIDSIQVGSAPFKSTTLYYDGPKPPTPPRWMEEGYELNLRDILLVSEQMLATSEFEGRIELVPYAEFDSNGDRVYSNLNSGLWANRQAVSIQNDSQCCY
jgi:hypothetical protein